MNNNSNDYVRILANIRLETTSNWRTNVKTTLFIFHIA